MNNMHFLWIFLIFVLTMTLAQSQELSSLPNFAVANRTFALIDKNNDNIMELTECLHSFNTFKKNSGDTSIARAWFVEKMVGYGQSSTVGDYVFTHYDRNGDGVLEDSDFRAMYILFNRDGIGSVSRDDFIRYYANLLTQAQAG